MLEQVTKGDFPGGSWGKAVVFGQVIQFGGLDVEADEFLQGWS